MAIYHHKSHVLCLGSADENVSLSFSLCPLVPRARQRVPVFFHKKRRETRRAANGGAKEVSRLRNSGREKTNTRRGWAQENSAEAFKTLYAPPADANSL
jgi:hypothetical protein